jgi:hypothetical protein
MLGVPSYDFTSLIRAKVAEFNARLGGGQAPGFAEGGMPGISRPGLIPGPVTPGGGDNTLTPTQTGEYIFPVDAVMGLGVQNGATSHGDALAIGKHLLDKVVMGLKKAMGNNNPPRNADAPAPGLPTTGEGFAEGGMIDEQESERGLDPSLATDDTIAPGIPLGRDMRDYGTTAVAVAPVVAPAETMSPGYADAYLSNDLQKTAIHQAVTGQGNTSLISPDVQPNLARPGITGVGASGVGSSPALGLGSGKPTMTPSKIDMSVDKEGYFKTPHAIPAQGTGIMQVEGGKVMDVTGMGPNVPLGAGGVPSGMSKKAIGYTPEGTPVYEGGGKRWMNGTNGWEEVGAGVKVGHIGVLKEGTISSLTPEAKHDLAIRYAQTGQLPPLGMGAAAAQDREAILSEWSKIMHSNGGTVEDQIMKQSALKASQGELNKIQGQRGVVMAFAKTASSNLELVEQLSEEVGRTGVPLLNKWVLAGKRSIAGDPDTAKFEAAVRTAINEYAKVTSSATGGQVTSDSARKEVESMLNTAQTPEQVTQVIKLLRQEINNRATGYDEQIKLVKEAISGQPMGAPGITTQSGGSPQGEAMWKEPGTNSVPMKAVDFLKANRGNSDALKHFDEKYGKGYAAYILSK